MLRIIPYPSCWVSVTRPFASLLSSSAGRSLGVVLVAKEGKLLVSSVCQFIHFSCSIHIYENSTRDYVGWNFCYRNC